MYHHVKKANVYGQYRHASSCVPCPDGAIDPGADEFVRAGIAGEAAPFVGLMGIGATATVWYFHTSWINNPENPSNPLSRNATV